MTLIASRSFHRAVTIGDAVEVRHPIEHAARLNAPVEHVGQQLFDVGAHRCRPTSN